MTDSNRKLDFSSRYLFNFSGIFLMITFFHAPISHTIIIVNLMVFLQFGCHVTSCENY